MALLKDQQSVKEKLKVSKDQSFLALLKPSAEKQLKQPATKPCDKAGADARFLLKSTNDK